MKKGGAAVNVTCHLDPKAWHQDTLSPETGPPPLPYADKSPDDYTRSSQQTDGGIGSPSGPAKNGILARDTVPSRLSRVISSRDLNRKLVLTDFEVSCVIIYSEGEDCIEIALVSKIYVKLY